MGEAYRGLTIQFKADGTSVMATLKSMTRAANQVESELRMVKKGLRFDGASTRLAQAQMKLLAEKAGAVGAEVIGLRRRMRELGEVEFGGEKMKELSARTRDASTQASLMLSRYNSVTAELAKMHSRMTELWTSSKRLTDISKKGPFENWDKMSVEGIKRAIDVMEKFGAISKEEAEKAKAAVASLRAEFKVTEGELKTLNSVAEYQSMGVKLAQEAAKAKAAIKEMVAAAKTLRGTGFEGRLEGSRAAVERLSASAKELKAAMRLDPKSYTLATMHADALKGKVTALKAESAALRQEMDHLGQTAGVKELAADMGLLVTKMNKNQVELEQTAEKLTILKARATEASDRVEKLKNDLRAAGKADQIGIDEEVAKANAELSRHNAAVEKAEQEWKQATKAAEQYARAVKYGDNAMKAAANDATVAAMKQAQSKKFKLLSSSAATALGMTMYSSLYPAVMMAGTYAIQAAEDVDAAYRNMRKTVQGTDEEFEHLKKSAMEFGDTHYTAADQLLQIESIGGQLGITVDNLEAFSKTIANLNIATNVSDAEELATQFGKMASVMGLSNAEYDKFADSLVRLGNSEPAMESDILNMTTRFMGMGKVVGMSSDEMLAWATAAVATGQKAEAAGSSMLRMTGRFEAAVAGVASMENLEDLTEEDIEALQTATDKLQGYADVAGMTAEQFSKLWETSPSEALKSFVEGLHRMDQEGGSAVQALKDLGINNVRDQQLFLGLANTTDVLNDSLVMSKDAWNGVDDQWGDAGDAAREAEKKMQGFSGALQIMKNNGQHLASMMGESLTPVLKDLTGLIQTAVGAFSQLDPEIQKNITLLILGSAALGPLLTAYGAVSNAAKSAKASWREYTSEGNKLQRMEQSRFATVTGMTDKYKKYGAEIDKTKAKIETLNKRMQNPAVKNNPVYSGIAQKNIAKMNREITKTQLKMSAFTKFQALGGLAGSIGSMAAVSVALVGLEKVGTYLYDAYQKAEEYRKSTDGLLEAANRVKESSDIVKNGFKGQGEAISAFTYSAGKYREGVQEMAARGAELFNNIDSRLTETFSNAQLAETYADQIKSLAGKCDGSAEKVYELKTAVDLYNQLTGDSITVTDEFTGAINRSTAELDANTAAYQANAVAKAYASVYEDAAKQVAELNVKIKETENGMKAAEQALGSSTFNDLVEQSLDPSRWEEYNNTMRTLSDSQREAWNQYIEGTGALQGYEKELEAAKTLEETARVEMVKASGEAAATARKQQEIAREASKASTYYKALGKDGEAAFNTLREQAGFAEDQNNDFSKALHDAGIEASALGNIGTDTFSRLLGEAQQVAGDVPTQLALVEDAMSAVNDFGFDPKKITITDDGAVMEWEGHIVDLNNMTFDDKQFEVTANGLEFTEEQTVMLEDSLARLDATRATPTVTLNDQASSAIDQVMQKVGGIFGGAGTLAMSAAINVNDSGVSAAVENTKASLNKILDKTVTIGANDNATGLINSVRNNLDRLDGQTATTHIDNYITEHRHTEYTSSGTPGRASGGVSRIPLNIPRNAAGGISGIAAKPIITNQGWVGENGTEAMLSMGRRNAIVPLSNRRYVRPFARAVASEMGGSGSTSNRQVNVTVNLDYSAGDDGTRIAFDIADKLGALMDMEA